MDCALEVRMAAQQRCEVLSKSDFEPLRCNCILILTRILLSCDGESITSRR
jgi:hypothetical protein